MALWSQYFCGGIFIEVSVSKSWQHEYHYQDKAGKHLFEQPMWGRVGYHICIYFLALWQHGVSFVQFPFQNVALTLWRPATFKDFRKNFETHVALRRNFSAPVQVTDLVEASTAATSLLVCT